MSIKCRNMRYEWPGNEESLIVVDDLDIPSGQTVFLHGPSGSGKTTFLGLLGGVVEPDAGELEVLGVSLQGLRASERDEFRADHIGYIFQLFNLLPYLSIRDNIALALRFSARKRERLRRASRSVDDEILRILDGLEMPAKILERRVDELSVGQQQRVAAARALVGHPELIIADEPTSALDGAARDVFLRLLFRECEKSGASLVCVSHDKAVGSFFDHSLAMGDLVTQRAATR